jgi:hypothetical protein
MSTRAQIVAELARRIVGRASGTEGHPLRVAVTGITASGKSTLATELRESVERLGRPCHPLSLGARFGRGLLPGPDLGGERAAETLYRQRYPAAQRIYFAEASPLRHADALFANDDLDAPALYLRAT